MRVFPDDDWVLCFYIHTIMLVQYLLSCSSNNYRQETFISPPFSIQAQYQHIHDILPLIKLSTCFAELAESLVKCFVTQVISSHVDCVCFDSSVPLAIRTDIEERVRGNHRDHSCDTSRRQCLAMHTCRY